MKALLFTFFLIITSVLSAQNHRLVVDPGAHKGQIRDLLVTPDKKYIISASFDKTIRKWDIEQGEIVQEYRGKIGPGAEGLVYFIDLSPDGKYLAAGGWFGADDESEDVGDIRIFDYKSGKIVQVLKGLSSPPHSLHFTADSKTVIAGDIYSKIFQWDIQSGRKIATFDFHQFLKDKTLLEHCGEGQEMMSVDEAHNLCYWDINKPSKPTKVDRKTLTEIYKLAGGGLGDPGNLAISPTHEDYAFSIENYIILLNKKKKAYFLIQNKYKPGFIKFSADGQRLLTGCVARGQEQHAYVFEKKGKEWLEIADFADATASMITGDFIDDQTFVTAGGENNTIYIWSLEKNANGTQKLIKSFEADGLTAQAVGLDGGIIGISDVWTENFGLSKINKSFDLFLKTIGDAGDQEFRKPETEQGDWSIKWCRTEEGLDGLTAGLQISQKGKPSDTIFRDSYNGSRHTVYTFAPNGMIISGGNYGHIEVYGTDTRLFNRLVGHEGAIYGMALSQDGKRLITSSDDHTIRIWPLDKLGQYRDDQIPYTFEEYLEKEVNYENVRNYLKAFIKQLKLEELSKQKSIKAWEKILDEIDKYDDVNATSGLRISLDEYRCVFIYPIVSMFMNKRGEWIIWDEKGYFSASKNGAKYVGYYVNQGKDKEAKFYPFEQFDLKYNRPDIILEDLGLGSPQIRNFYYRAYLKRLQKMGMTEEQLEGDIHLPTLALQEQQVSEDRKHVRIKVSSEDSKYMLDRIQVHINDVPIYGRDGIKLNASHQSTNELNLELAEGKNKIEISVLNNKGSESLREVVYVFNPKSGNKPNLYLVSIGTSKYKDSRFDLKYASKDAKDLVGRFKNSGSFSNIYHELLVDEQSTKENVAKLKDFLSKAGRNDVVMVFVAGHGLLDEDLNYYYATFDTDFNDPGKRGILYEELEKILDQITALKKLLFIDTCHSGEVDKEEVEKSTEKAKVVEDVQFRNAGVGVRKKKGVGLNNTSELMKELYTDLRRGTGATVISSAGGAEYAMESDQWKNGLFTYCLLHGIGDLSADTNKDGKILVSELQDYVREEVVRLSGGKQKPSTRLENISLDYSIWEK
ncbi:MAG: hypothetical protein EP338_08830 [Bacteroidetes bacterium]|nr:MAG: hypothetical protein EP338_08830 [Bacteroidota bacterium]